MTLTYAFKGDWQLLPKFIIKDFIEKFDVLNNKNANVYIKHLLYGCQRIKGCVLHTLWDGERVGLIINDEDIYITMDELLSVSINENECVMKSEVMEIEIQI